MRMLRRVQSISPTSDGSQSVISSCCETNEDNKTYENDRSKSPESRMKVRQIGIKTSSWKKTPYLLILLLGFGICLCSVVLTSLYATVSLDPHKPRITNNHHGFQLVTESAPSCNVSLGVDDISFTLAIQLSIDRLWMVQHHCERWGKYPISLAVMTTKKAPDIKKRVIELGCHDEHLTVNVVDSKKYNDTDYPVNELRNVALKGVETSHVVFVDVDFWVSEKMYDTLMLDNVREALVEDHQLALVLPAFQLLRHCNSDHKDCKQKTLKLMPRSMPDLARMLMKERGRVFDARNFGGHGSTRYTDWFFQDPGSLLEIDCVQSNRYEPFMAFRYCRELPPFQEQFSGYGKNKMTWAMQIIRSGYRIFQVGGAYLVHYPHRRSKSRKNWMEGPEELQKEYYDKDGNPYKLLPKDIKTVDWSKYKRGEVDKEFVLFRNWLYESIPDQSKIGRCDEAQDDDAKLWIDRSEFTSDVIRHIG